MLNQRKKNKTVALIPAAGSGKRFGVNRNKPFHTLKDKPLLIWPLETLQKLPEIHEIVPVIREDALETAANLIEQYGISKVKKIVPGGIERQDSVYNALKSIDTDTYIVLIHDGVRPFLDAELIRGMLLEFSNQDSSCQGVKFDGIVTGVPVKDTIKEVQRHSKDDASCILVKKTLKRDVLWAIQTPQVFLYDKLIDVHERAKKDKFYATDDSALVEKYGGVIKVSIGSYRNIKITTLEDMKIAEAYLL